jgi:hypothetical protein
VRLIVDRVNRVIPERHEERWPLGQRVTKKTACTAFCPMASARSYNHTTKPRQVSPAPGEAAHENAQRQPN